MVTRIRRKVGNAGEASIRVSLVVQERFGLLKRAGHELKFSARIVLGNESSHEVTVHLCQYMPEVLRVRTVESLPVAEPQWFAGSL